MLCVKLNKNTRAVLEAVQRMGNHPTAYEIYAEVKQNRPGVGLATVYRAARRLVDMGLLRGLDGGPNAGRYDARMERHDHVLCTCCGALLDLPVEIAIQAEVARQAAKATGMQMVSHEVRLYGLCQSCASSRSGQEEVEECAETGSQAPDMLQ